MARPPTPCRPRAQRGAYAIEFAFVFLMFFGLIYVTLCYGVALTLRMGLQHAAEEGARAALRYQRVVGTGDPLAQQLQMRRAQAATVAASRVDGWFAAPPVVVAQICQSGTDDCTTPVCGADWTKRCQIRVQVTASGIDGMLPTMDFAMPATLTGQASMLLDLRTP
ncbi:MAG TPA: TadE/TadG family type IV pilus assembly protein [Variovorax sp.]|nr:TadE/TadG family type IV pilus assembly protein [Variovorax sp.]